MERVETIKVGNVSMMVQTVPVTVLLDEFDDTKLVNSGGCIHFKLIEVDGIFIVSVESFYLNSPSDIIYKGFLTSQDAYSYLELYGVTDGNKKT